jgi:hypothetical protein
MADPEYFEYQGKTYDVTFNESETVRHGGPFDRGSADSYYGREICPHYYVGDTFRSHRIEKSEMTKRELGEYYAGYEYNETVNKDFKDWG